MMQLDSFSGENGVFVLNVNLHKGKNMKYTTMVKSALALALGLVVGMASATTTDVQKYGATFESTGAPSVSNDYAYAVGDKLNAEANGQPKYQTVTGGATSGWLVGSADDESAISNRTDAAGGQMLWLNTDASTLTNKLESQVATDINAGIADKGAFFESEIKFVASDTLDPGIEGGTDDAKFAIYAYCKEDGMPTNLVVYHAYYDPNDPDLELNGGIGYTNEVFSSVDIDVTKYTKIRVEMKQVDVGGEALNIFSVSVDGGAYLTSSVAYQDDVWLLTTEAAVLANKAVSALTFKGTGEIDNLNVGVITEEETSATVISVALVGGATYTDANGVLTFTAPQGYAISSIYTNGVDTGSTTTFSTNGLSGNVNIVVAATKVRAAPEHKWWENPGVVGTTAHGLDNASTYGARYMNGAGDFVAATGWTHNKVVKGFDLDDLIAGSASAIITNRYNDDSAGTWGVAISPALNVMLVGANWGEKKLISYPLNEAGVVGQNAFIIETDNVPSCNLCDMEFTADSQYLYALDYETQYVYKYRVLNGLKSDGTNLVRVATYDFGATIGAIGLGQFQGGDVLYAIMLNDGVIKYIDTTAATPTATALGVTAATGGWGDIMISAADTATPRITIIGGAYGFANKSLAVYTLNATGTAVVGEPLLSLDATALEGIGLEHTDTYGYSGYITENEETFIFGWDNKLCAIQYVAPPEPTVITVAQTIGAHGSSVSNGNFQASVGVDVPITITAAQGYVIAQIVTNGAPVADVLGEDDVTFNAVFSGAQGANNSIIATFAKDNAWYLDPFIRNEYGASLGNEGVQAAALDEANGIAVFGRAPGASSVGQVAYELANLTNDFGKVVEAFTASGGSNSNGGEYWGRSIAAIPPFSATIACNYNNAYAQVFPYEGPWVGEGSATYTVQFDMGESGLSVPYLYPIAANKAGTFLYGVDKGGAKIYKFAIVADVQDATKIGSLEYAASWDFTGGGDLKGIGVGTFNGNDVVYMAKNASRGLWTLDVATGTLTKTGAAIDCEVYDIIVTGQAAGTPRLVVAGGPRVFVYDLAPDGTLLVDSPVFKCATTSLFRAYTPVGGTPATTEKARLGVVAVDDETRIVLGWSSSTTIAVFSVVEKKPANLIVRGTFDDGATVEETAVAFGDPAEVTFNAPAGATITAVTVNGAAQQVAEGATSYTYESACLEQYVYVAMTAALPTYAVDWTGSQHVDVSVDGDAWDGGTSGSFTNGTIVTFTPDSGMTITNIDGVAVSGYAADEAFTLTVTQATNIVVIADTVQPIGRIKPEWAEQADTTKFWAWVDAKGVSDYANTDYTAQYLFNADEEETVINLRIVSIEVGPSATTIVVSGQVGRGIADLEHINGVLSVATGTSPSNLTPKAISNVTYDENGDATITIPAGNGSFFRARVDFAAPETALTTAE